MKISNKNNAMRTTIPALVRDVLKLKQGDKLIWHIKETKIEIEKEIVE